MCFLAGYKDKENVAPEFGVPSPATYEISNVYILGPTDLEPGVWQPLPSLRNLPLTLRTNGRSEYLNPSPLIIFLPLHFCRERNSRHNPISKFLGNDILVRIPIYLNNLEQSIDDGITRR